MSDHSGGDNRYTRGIAEFVAGLRYDAIPGEVRQRIKLLILDSLGCAHLRRRSSNGAVS